MGVGVCVCACVCVCVSFAMRCQYDCMGVLCVCLLDIRTCVSHAR